MIAVIADDFTGAAEIGGVGLKYGLRVVIETQVNGIVDTDLLVIAADTRALTAEVAADNIKCITNNLLQQNPEFIFKKLDSVLRGNVAEEIIAQLEVSGQKRAIVVAGNPSFGRVIENGIYKVNSIPLAETWFAKDSGFVAYSSKVTEMVVPENINTYSLPVEAHLPDQGIIIGDVKDKVDMEKWAEKINDDTLIAGGAGFFDVLISRDFKALNNDCKGCMKLKGKTLIVFGSKYPKDSKLPIGLNEENTLKSNMPDEIYANPDFDPELIIKWADEIVNHLSADKKVIITIEQNYSVEEKLPKRLRLNIGELVRLVISKTKLRDLLIEGGATTSAILKALEVKKLFPNQLIHQGIIQMNTDAYPDMTITTKPGSYLWPENELLYSDDDLTTEQV